MQKPTLEYINGVYQRFRTMMVMAKLRHSKVLIDLGGTPWWWWKIVLRYILTGKVIRPKNIKIYGQEEA